MNRLAARSCTRPASRFDNNSLLLEDCIELIETGVELGSQSLEGFRAVVTVVHFVLCWLAGAAANRAGNQPRQRLCGLARQVDTPDISLHRQRIADLQLDRVQSVQRKVNHEVEAFVDGVQPDLRPGRPVLISRHARIVGDQRTPAGKSPREKRKPLNRLIFSAPTRLKVREPSAAPQISSTFAGGADRGVSALTTRARSSAGWNGLAT